MTREPEYLYIAGLVLKNIETVLFRWQDGTMGQQLPPRNCVGVAFVFGSYGEALDYGGNDENVVRVEVAQDAE